MSTDKEGKVLVRIAVAVDCEGNWNACGWGGKSFGDRNNNYDLMDLAVEPLSDSTSKYWIEAWVDVPKITTVEGMVIPVPKGETK